MKLNVSIFGLLIAIGANSVPCFASDYIPEPAPAQKTVIVEKREIPAFFQIERIPIQTETVTVSRAVKNAPTNPKMAKVPMTGKLKSIGNCDTGDCKFSGPSSTPLWYGQPKMRDDSRELVKTVEYKNGVPWWDDSISQFDSKDFRDDFEYKTEPVKEWKWFAGDARENHSNGGYDYRAGSSWDANVDYENFEYMSADEYARRKTAATAGGYVDPWVDFYEKRSCPPGISVAECKKLMETPHFVENIPAVAPGIPVLSDHDRYTQRAVEELFLTPHQPNSYWVTNSNTATSAIVTKTEQKIEKTAPSAIAPTPVAPAPVPEPVAPVMPTPIAKPILTFNVGGKCDPSSTMYAYETCAGTQYVDCPFATEWECEIWLKKPHMRETIAPKSKKIKQVNVDSLVALINSGVEINADTMDAAPLVKRYDMLRTLSRTCCTEGMVYNLKKAGGTDDLIYKFLVDDANFYGFGERCLMMTDGDLDKYLNTATANVVGDVRNSCICRQKETFRRLLSPFQQVGEQAPNFSNQSFDYTYTDGLGRSVSTSINTDVKNVLSQLEQCP